MKLASLPAEFEAALPILQTLEAAGYEAYFVGGSVRDTLLNKPIHDVDIATSAFPAEVKALFKKTVDTGIEHGTVMILDHGQGYETTTFRTESDYTDYRRPDEVTFVRSLEEDLKRRDFTVNALALKPDGTVVDLFDGLQDLEHHILRAVGKPEERFHEDALRMMRAARFAAQLGFEIEPETQAAIKDNAQLLAHISVERVNVEFTKLMQGPAANYGLLELLRGRLNLYMYGLEAADIDLLGYADLLKQAQPANDQQAWVLLAFELGLTPDDTASFLRQWKHSREMINTASRSITLLNALRLDDVSNWQLYSVGSDIQTALAVADLSELVVDTDRLAQRYDALPIHSKKELAVTGADLMQTLQMQPGPQIGQLLSQVEHEVVENQIANDKTALLYRIVELTNKEKK
ncbi:tRNA nucleotidyltransferase (CCA-adding enzyme) [Weissella uvarum]|uniref:CCA tRNA nucleotidyltransferase n=1 Tax=Weissella uvarum TaxID=1479233 RepID=UPI001960CBFE|nr:CCA tRNA nucleotidyltransferase [Weissella uvarum]MBM7617090.1 tRNA nucleotidyltransferase (CCA-adding enzyme) [Weissella uvarum]MCM0595386.1 CCA tRNA nucleotidyltransferase [Weissella uvarum]